jgi:hypothetical protein
MTLSQIKKRIKYGQISRISQDSGIPLSRVRNVLSGKVKNKEAKKEVVEAFAKEFSKTK